MTSLYHYCALFFAFTGGGLSAPFSFHEWQFWAIGVPFNFVALVMLDLAGKGS